MSFEQFLRSQERDMWCFGYATEDTIGAGWSRRPAEEEECSLYHELVA